MLTLLRHGSRGKDVEKLQLCLDKLFPLNHPSILRPDGSADGIFGPQTKQWVKDFQRVPPAISDDGVVGPITWNKLKDKLPLSFAGTPIDEVEERGINKGPKEKIWDKWSSEQAFNLLSKEEKRDFFDNLENEFGYVNLKDSPVAEFLVNHKLFSIGVVFKLAQVAELITVVASSASWLAAAGPLSVFTTAVSNIVAWYSAVTTNTRMYEARAWAYTVTAWAMGKTRPESSPYMMDKFKSWSSTSTIYRREEAWRNKSIETWNSLESLHLQFNSNKRMMQLTIQLMAMNQPRGNTVEEKLCYRLLKSKESSFGGVYKEDANGKPLNEEELPMESINWRQGYDILYPR